MTQQSLRISIQAGARRIVDIDNFEAPENAVTFLFGESGIGKSMVCKAVYGLLDPGEVSVETNGRSYHDHCNDPWTKGVQRSSFFVFQEPSSHLNGLMRIGDQLREGSLSSTASESAILQRLWQTSDDAAVRAILEVFPKPYRPSGGEKQRVLLAMAFKKLALLRSKELTHEPTLFVFDEPTGSLDDNYRNLFLRLLFEKYAARPFTAVVITHDYSMISEVSRAYPHLRQGILFKELSRCDNGTVASRDFSAQEYLGWIGATRPAARVNGDAAPVLEVESDVRVFGRHLRICSDLQRQHSCNLRVRAGQMAYLKAASGVGKTTIAKIVMGLYKADAFSMTLAGRKVTDRSPADTWRKHLWGKRAGMVFQHADEALNLQATVAETFRGLPGAAKLTGSELKARLGTLFAGEISEAFLEKKVALLSGGQKQRLNLLRTLVLDTDLVILDEPLNGLDFVSVKKVVAILQEKLAAGAALLMISHNEEIFDALVAPENVYYLAEA